MAWGVKYRITFKDIEDVLWYIYIQEDNWAGAVTDFTPGANPLEIEYSTSGKHEPIAGSAVTIQVLYESGIDALFIEEERALRVYIDTDDFEWYGYIVPFQYYRKLSGRPHYASFIATDQLGILSEKKFEDDSGDPVFYVKTDMEMIQTISDRAGLDLSMRESVNVYEDSFDSDPEDSPLTQVYSHAGQYWDEVTDERTDCHTVLTDILKKYNARICQWGLEWWIQRPQTLWSSHTTRHHSAAGSYLSNTIASRKYIMQDEGAKWRADPTIAKKPRAGRVEVMVEPRRLENIFKNSTFDDFTQYGSPADLYYWTVTGADVYDGYLDMGTVSPTTSTAGIATSVTMANVTSIQLVVDFRAEWGASATAARLFFNITSTLSGESYTNSGWTTVGDLMYSFDVYAALSGTSMSEYGTFTLEIPNPGGLNSFDKDTLSITIFDCIVSTSLTDSLYYIRNARLEVGYQSGASMSWPYSRDNDVTSFHTIKDNLRQIDADKEQYVQDYATINGIYPASTHYYLQKSTTDYDNTSEWFIVGHKSTVAGLQSIQRMLCRQYLEAENEPTDEIQGTLKGRYNYTMGLVDTDIVDSYGFPKVFIGQNLTFDARNVEWTGTWIEIAPIYTEQTAQWSGVNYFEGSVDGDELTVGNQTTSGTDYARTTAYTAVAGENLRFKITLVNDGGSALPNYSFDGDSGELEWGDNYLEFRCDTAGSYYLEINHTDGEQAHFTATYEMYSLTGI